MADFTRMVTFDADEASLKELVGMIESSDGPPPGVNASRIIVLANRASGKVAVVVRFPSEEDMRAGAAVLEGMDPPSGMQRLSVDEYEVVLERTS